MSTIVAVRLLHRGFAGSKIRPKKRANIQFLHADGIVKAVKNTMDYIDPMRDNFSNLPQRQHKQKQFHDEMERSNLTRTIS